MRLRFVIPSSEKPAPLKLVKQPSGVAELVVPPYRYSMQPRAGSGQNGATASVLFSRAS